MEKKFFSLPKISACGRFVYFNFVNPDTCKFKRFKKHLPKNITGNAAKLELNRLVDYWTTELKNGYNPFIERNIEQQTIHYNYVEKSVMDACKIRTEFLRKKSSQTYTSKVDVFSEWVQSKKLGKLLAVDFTRENAEDFLRYLQSKRNIGATTRNSYLVTMRTLFKTMQEKGIVKENVWDCIKKIGEARLGKLPFKQIMKIKLKDYFKNNDTEMWLFVQFMYYCFIRPGELRVLTVGAIDLDDGTILIDAKISKNKKSEYVIIPPAFLSYLIEIGITDNKHSFYIFSPGGIPGDTPYSSDVFNRRHKAVTGKFGYNVRYTLYSWKHTGAVDAIRAGVKIKELQLQLRHKDLQTTDIYLRSIGINDLDDLRKNFPTL